MAKAGTTTRTGWAWGLVVVLVVSLAGWGVATWWSRPALFEVVELPAPAAPNVAGGPASESRVAAAAPAVVAPAAPVVVASAAPVVVASAAPAVVAPAAPDVVAPAAPVVVAPAAPALVAPAVVVPAPVVQQAAPVVPAAPVVAPAAEAPVPAAPGPSFDVVRVGPQGSAVIAGRAAPGSEVVVRDGATEVARTRADRQGSFVAIPAAPLAPGGRELTLSSRGAGGGEVAGDGSVLLAVPPRPESAAVAAVPAPAVAPLVTAVLVPRGASPRVLQEGPAAAPGPKPGLTLDVVDYDDAGAIRFTGGGRAGGSVRVYVDNGPAGDAAVDQAGRWTMTPPVGVSAGVHTLRVDQVDGAGRVSGRVELPFQRTVLSASELSGGQVVVQPGQTLWRMARVAYGRGIQYRVIYLANREHIRDPRLIYPGQTFAIPVAAETLSP